MSDDANAGGAAAGEQETSAPATGGDAGAQETRSGAGSAASSAQSPLADLGGDDGGDAPAAPATWPEDWRNKLTGGDEAGMAIAKRFATPEAMFQKILAQEQTIRRGWHKAMPVLDENPTEEQIAEYRRALDIPETPEGYGIQFAPEAKATEADNAMLQGFLADMHGRNMPPAYAKAAFDWYQSQMTRMREESEANFQREFAKTRAELKQENGPDHLRNIKLVEEMIERMPGLGKLVIANRHDKQVMKDMIALARETADEEALYGGDGSGGGRSLDERKQELLVKSVDGTLTKAEDDELNKVLEAIHNRDERRERRGRAA